MKALLMGIGLGALTTACSDEADDRPSDGREAGEASANRQLRLLYSNNVNGDIEPCG